MMSILISETMDSNGLLNLLPYLNEGDTEGMT